MWYIVFLTGVIFDVFDVSDSSISHFTIRRAETMSVASAEEILGIEPEEIIEKPKKIKKESKSMTSNTKIRAKKKDEQVYIRVYYNVCHMNHDLFVDFKWYTSRSHGF